MFLNQLSVFHLWQRTSHIYLPGCLTLPFIDHHLSHTRAVWEITCTLMNIQPKHWWPKVAWTTGKVVDNHGDYVIVGVHDLQPISSHTMICVCYCYALQGFESIFSIFSVFCAISFTELDLFLLQLLLCGLWMPRVSCTETWSHRIFCCAFHPAPRTHLHLRSTSKLVCFNFFCITVE